MKNVMPMQPYLVLDTDDYEVKKEMKSGISHFYEFSKKKSLKEEMKAVPDGSVDLLFGIGEQDVKTCIGGTVLAAKGWEFEDGRSYFGVRFQPGSCILPEELPLLFPRKTLHFQCCLIVHYRLHFQWLPE